MARISAEQRRKNKEFLDEIVREIFWEDGWNGVTLDSISERSGFKRSVVQNYFPTKRDMGEALRGSVFPVMMEQLDLTNTDEFKISWEVAIRTSLKFRMVVHMLIANSINENTNDMTVSGIVRLRKLLSDKWGSEAQAIESIYNVLGMSVVLLAQDFS
ncbi:TetR family transcriptional regulator [Vibrio fortis]|uniref:TetR family transcriptional regulator n=1 Tax=Vibrio harveyi TaxID=669 RepID=UPI0006487F7F|nr:TetR family transcriptional regulator [Vibrio harveyi]